MFEWFLSDPDSPFTITYRSIEDWLEVLIDVLRHGAFEQRSPQYVHLDVERMREMAADKLATHPAHPIYGSERCFSRKLYEWPDAWLRLHGLDPEDRDPRGATHTTAELKLAVKPLRARIHARVLRSSGTRVVVTDDTGDLEVQCPLETWVWTSSSNRYEQEFELALPVSDPAAPGGEAPAPRIDTADPSADAIAVSVRPLRAYRGPRY